MALCRRELTRQLVGRVLDPKCSRSQMVLLLFRIMLKPTSPVFNLEERQMLSQLLVLLPQLVLSLFSLPTVQTEDSLALAPPPQCGRPNSLPPPAPNLHFLMPLPPIIIGPSEMRVVFYILPLHLLRLSPPQPQLRSRLMRMVTLPRPSRLLLVQAVHL